MSEVRAPVVLFVYNRPEHTRRTVAALLENELAEQSDLFVYSDGPKSESDRLKVEQVRDCVSEIVGFRNVEVIKRTENIGLAQSIISGVTEVVNRFGRVIVLEDDIVTSRYFLRYMNAALERYKDVDRVMHVSGYMFPINKDCLPETFFYRSTSCWGWGTWACSWQYFEKKPHEILESFSEEQRQKFCLEGATDHWKQVIGNAQGKIDTWAVFWYASVFEKDGLCLHPAISLTANIGHDDSGNNCAVNKSYDVVLSKAPVSFFPEVIQENPLVVHRLSDWYKNEFSLFRRFAYKLKSLLVNT